MQEINYTSAIIWYILWPIVIYIGYKFAFLNAKHLEENLEKKD